MGMIKLVYYYLILQAIFYFVSSFEVQLEENRDRIWKSIPLEENRQTGLELECRLMEGGSLTAGSVTWIYKKDNKTTNAKHIVTDSVIGNPRDRYSLVGNNLVIKPLRKRDSGTYSCEGTDHEKHSSKPGYYYILITYVPSIPKCGYSTNRKIAIDTSDQLTCQSDGVPFPTYTWFKDKKRLPTRSSDNPAYDLSNFYYSPESGQFVFEVVSEHDDGEYSCQAANSRGSISCPAFSLTTYEDTALRLASSPKERQKLIGGTIGGVFAALVIIGLPIIFIARKRSWFRSRSCPKCPAQKRRRSTGIFVTTVDGVKIEESKMLSTSPTSSSRKYPKKDKKFFRWF